MNSQRNIFYVPWADFSEWNNVREQMFSADINDTIKAYQTIQMWKLKYHSIPAYVECTYTLLQVMVKEYEMSKNDTSSVLFNENDLQLSYSMALIRFVNHVLSINSDKGASLYLAAKTQNIPDWIINMRHDVSHGQDLPTLDALHQAAELSLQWLLDYYWANEKNSEEKSLDLSQFDLDSGNFEAGDVDIQKFFKKLFDLWDLCQNKNYKNLQYVVEVDREFMLQLEDVFASYNNYFSSENEAYTVIKNIITTNNQRDKNEGKPAHSCKFKQFRIQLLKFIKGIIKAHPQLKDLLVLSLLESAFLSEKSIEPLNWEKVLHLLQQTNSFQFLLENLLELGGKGHKGALNWLSALAPAIRHLRKQWAMFKVLYKEQKSTETKLLKDKVRKTLQPKSTLAINLDVAKLPVLTLESIKSALLNVENFTLDDIIEYLNLVKPSLMKETLDLIIEAANLQKGTNCDVNMNENDRIYTVEDLSEILVGENSVIEESSGRNGWTKTSIGVDIWNKCPVGRLPFQSKVDCNLPSDLKWKRRKLSQKTLPVPLVRHGVAMKKILQS